MSSDPETIIRSPIASPGAWYGPELSRATDWLHPITADHQSELLEATAAARAQQIDLAQIGSDTFSLPGLMPLIHEIENQIENGPGLIVLRGLDLDGLTPEDAGLMFYAIGQRMGRPIKQNAQGHLLGHVRDTGRDIKTDPSVRGYQTRVALPFHTDTSTDLLGLLCFRTAKEGGESFLAPLMTIYNEILRKDPDMIETLYETFHYDCREEKHPDGHPFYSRTAASFHAGKLSLRHNSGYAKSAQRHPTCPRLTEDQLRVMAEIDRMSFDPEIHFSLKLERGDILFVNNYQVMHARSGFVDHEDPARRRHLMRLWLHLHRGRELAPEFDNRGGLVTTEAAADSGLSA